jgi:3-hydroxyisobutyrate dehydrogenase
MTKETNNMRVSFLGLGNMGGSMSRNLAQAGVNLTVYDLDPERAAPALAHGAILAASAAQAAATADVVITMLPTPAIVEDVLLGSGGVLAAMAPGSLWVDMSTSVPAVAAKVAQAAAAKGVRILDAPVSGMSKGANAGLLQIFVGGDEADLQQALPLLNIMGDPERVLHVGGAGAGYAVKLMINALWFDQLVAIAEILTIGVKAGVDLSVLHRSLVASPANSTLLERDFLPILESGDYDEGFAIALACKDIRLAVELADAVGVRAPLNEVVKGAFDGARERFGDLAGEMIPVRSYEVDNGIELRTAVSV